MLRHLNIQLATKLAISTCALAALSVVLLFAQPWLPISVGILHGVVVCIGLATVGSAGLLAWILKGQQQQQATTQTFLQRIGQLDYHDVDVDQIERNLPPIAEGHPLREPLQRIETRFATNCEALREAEHIRAILDVRCRRATMQHDQIRKVIGSLNEAVLVVDHYDELVLANPSAGRLFGFEAGTVEHRALSQLIECDRLLELLAETRSRKAGSTRTDEIQIADSGGHSQWYSVTASSIDSDEEQTDTADSVGHGSVAVLRNISLQKAAQKRNAEFVSAVSHEMKTPLSSIKAYVEMLADGDAEDEKTREEFLDVINTQADRLKRLIDNLLNLARIEAGVVQVSKENISLNEVLEEAVNVVEPSAVAKSIELVSDLSQLYLRVYVDRDMMLQAAINLLSNAIKYTAEGGRVAIRSRLADKQVRFEVEDSGVGLSEEDREKVFDKFYRVKKDSQMAPGTGLGLPLAKHIVTDVHQGQLDVQSELGVGSTFSITLPSVGQMT